MKNSFLGFAFLLVFANGNLFNFSSRPTVSNVDYFLKIEGVNGESTADGHKKWIDILAVSELKKSRTRTGGDNYEPLRITKLVDRSSPILARYARSGVKIKSVLIDLPCPRGGDNFLRYELKNIYISSYQSSGSAGSDGVPTDSFSLNFSKIEVVDCR